MPKYFHRLCINPWNVGDSFIPAKTERPEPPVCKLVCPCSDVYPCVAFQTVCRGWERVNVHLTLHRELERNRRLYDRLTAETAGLTRLLENTPPAPVSRRRENRALVSGQGNPGEQSVTRQTLALASGPTGPWYKACPENTSPALFCFVPFVG